MLDAKLAAEDRAAGGFPLKRSDLKGGRRAALAAGAALLALAPSPLPAQASDRQREAAVKADFLIKFPAYVRWPASARPLPGKTLQICLLGRDPFDRLIDAAAQGQRVNGFPLQVRRVAGPGRAGGCHVAFIRSDVPATLEALKGKPVLTVTDSDAGAASGMIHFVTRQGRVRFTIDEAQAAKKGVRISSRLLEIALDVRRP